MFGDFEDALYAAAQSEARKAVRTHAHNDTHVRREASIAVGASAEYLIAALLVATDPVLLAEPGHVPSLVMLSRGNRESRINGATLRTANWGTQVKIAQEAYRELQGLDGRMRGLMEIRNAATHAAVSERALTAAVRALVGLVDLVHRVLPRRDVSDFWGEDLSEAVAKMRDASSSDTQRRVASKVSDARSRLGSVLEGLDQAGKLRMIGALEYRDLSYSSFGMMERTASCPACSQRGAIAYVKSRRTPTVATDPDGVEWATFPVDGVPVVFQCPVCGLTLEGDELAMYPAMAQEVPLEDEGEEAAIYYASIDPGD